MPGEAGQATQPPLRAVGRPRYRFGAWKRRPVVGILAHL
jgi:hypothetical protein